MSPSSGSMALANSFPNSTLKEEQRQSWTNYREKRQLLHDPFLPPLIVRIDVPDNALGEDLVLIECNDGSKSKRRDLLHHQRV